MYQSVSEVCLIHPDVELLDISPVIMIDLNGSHISLCESP